MLDAPLCSWSDCYSDSLAKSIGLALNSDGNLIAFDGTYWRQKANSSNYVKNHTITGNSYTTNSKESLKPIEAVGWASAFNLWYTDVIVHSTLNSAFGFWNPPWSYNRLDLIERVKTKTPCPNGFRLPYRTETTVYNSNGVPSTGWTWTASTPSSNRFNVYYWNNTSLRNRDFNEANYAIKCVK